MSVLSSLRRWLVPTMEERSLDGVRHYKQKAELWRWRASLTNDPQLQLYYEREAKSCDASVRHYQRLADEYGAVK